MRSVDESVAFFNKTVADLQNTYIPQKHTNNKCYPAWYNSTLIKTIKEKYRYLKKIKIYGNKSDESTFKFLRARVKKMEAHCYKTYLDLTEESIKANPKNVWTFVKKRPKSNSVPSSLTYKNQTLSTGESISDAFSNYFYSNFLENPSPNLNTFHTPSFRSSTSVFSGYSDDTSVKVNVENVRNLLQKLDTSKAAGSDNISPKLFV